MIRSLFTAISSLGLHQDFLDVISDNLANANTTGYKASTVAFQDQLAQMLNSGASPSESRGGINPTQIGLGSQLGFVSPVFTQGMIKSTGKSTDLAITGDGFFIYDQDTNRRYSRDGSVDLDSEGYLVNTATGLRIQGWERPVGSVDPIDTNQPISNIQISLESALAQATQNVNMGGNLDSTSQDGDEVMTSFACFDSMGNQHVVDMTFTRNGANNWDWEITGPATATGSGTITFTANGQYDSATGIDAITVPGGEGADDVGLTLDLSELTMLSTISSVSATYQDGLAAGSVSEIFVAPNNGEVYVVYTNGMKNLVGQVALARFHNPAGLIRAGQNLFEPGVNSGEPMIGSAGSGGRGLITAGALEASNVDMANEFTNMILAQRGFQASSRVISTSDEILQELVNLKR